MESSLYGRPSPSTGREAVLRERGDASTPAVRAEGASSEGWTLRAASVVGVRHRLAGQPSEDSFAWAASGSCLAVAVADGVGSTTGAGEAARRVAAAAAGSAIRQGVDAAVQVANQAAEGGGAATLVVARIDDEGDVVLGRVGDSTAFLVDKGQWSELFRPPDDDRSGTDTPALPCPRPEIETASARLAAGRILVLATDGIGDPWRDGPATVAPALVAALSQYPSALELAGLADFSRHGCHDDRTLLCIWPRSRD